MTRRRFRLEDGAPLGRDSVTGRIYCSAENFARVSAVRVATRPGQRHGLIRNTVCDRLYYVIRGEGVFHIGDETVEAVETDVLVIPRGTPYDYWGALEMLLVHVPANVDAADENLESPPFPV